MLNRADAGRTAPDGAVLIDGGRLQRGKFGGKAAELSVLVGEGANVPLAYAISASDVGRIIGRSLAEPVTNRLRGVFAAVVAASPSGQAIVRSSHPTESRGNGLLSGRFASVAGVSTFEGLLQAIRDIALERAKGGVKPHGPALPIVLQAQIPCSYSALVCIEARNVRVEMFRGGLAAPISGAGIPTVLSGSRSGFSSGGEPKLRLLSDAQQLGQEAVELAASLLEVVPDDSCRSDQRMLFEVGCYDGSWYFFQRQFFASRSASRVQAVSVAGRKAAAMIKFQGIGLFTKQLAVATPGQSLPDSIERWHFPITIRFALGDRLGLPRHFVTNREELHSVLIKRKATWSAIAHEFIPVTRSFELLLDEHDSHLEHVPGIWESESTCAPDALTVHNGGGCESFRFSDNRLCKDGTVPAGGEFWAAPIDGTLPRMWAQRLSELLPRLRAAFRDALPVNLHFVEDESGDWHFLNDRPGWKASRVVSGPFGAPHRVTAAADLKGWDGRQPILLAVTTARGSEHSLEQLARQLQKVDVPIYAEFGLLSHPALVLIAHGVRLLPSYAQNGGAAYIRELFALDVNNDPAARILAEEAVYADELVHVVPDRDPIASGHLLVVAKEAIGGFADRPDILRHTLSALEGRFGDAASGWLVYERGRARFCTSGFTTPHAHMHLVPLEYFAQGVLGEMAAELRAERFGSFWDAEVHAAQEIADEYLVFGDLSGEAYLRRGRLDVMEKRYVRRFLSARRA